MRLQLKMRIYDHHNDAGALVSFEIKNIGRSRACRFIKQAFPKATVRREQSEDFCAFDLNGRTFIINEPWGDNSRYLVHEESPQPSNELQMVRSAFEKYRPSWAFSGTRAFGIVLAVFAALSACLVVAFAWLSRR
jgi:hypothetical protein